MISMLYINFIYNYHSAMALYVAEWLEGTYKHLMLILIGIIKANYTNQ